MKKVDWFVVVLVLTAMAAGVKSSAHKPAEQAARPKAHPNRHTR